jgi:hypothetical protein
LRNEAELKKLKENKTKILTLESPFSISSWKIDDHNIQLMN